MRPRLLPDARCAGWEKETTIVMLGMRPHPTGWRPFHGLAPEATHNRPLRGLGWSLLAPGARVE